MNFSRLVKSAALALCLNASWAAHAGPNDYIRLPTVEYGERELDLKSGVQLNRDGHHESAHSLGFGFTPTSRWFTEVYAKYARPPEGAHQFDAWEWENRLQLTETGRYPLDLGVLLELERPQDRAEGYELTMGPMLQTERGRLQGNFNVFLQRHIRGSESTATELLYQTQVKYREARQFEWGVQGFGRVGQWDHWARSTDQEFKIGPALFGKIKTGTKQAVKWNAALLAGTTHATPKTTLRVQAEYEF